MDTTQIEEVSPPVFKPKNIRIIPRLDIKGPNVVKGVQLEGLRIVGRPELFALKYYEDGADELVYIDTVASLYGRNSLEEIIKRAAEQIFIPMTVGGGIRSVENIRSILRAGADKVAINTAAIKNPHLITQGARAFGSQCMVISIQARRLPSGLYECLTDNGRENTGLEVVEWAREAVNLGAGEILLTSVDNDGTGKGFDIKLVRSVSESVSVPVIASGGAGKIEHVASVINDGKADAVGLSSLLHYKMLYLMQKADYQEEGNIDFLKKNITSNFGSLSARNRISPVGIDSLKRYLFSLGISCRL